jgi:hypothetical protein
MTNPFQVTPLDAATPMRGLIGVVQQKRQKEAAEAKQLAQQEKMAGLVKGIQGGDRNAAIELAAFDPKVSKEIGDVLSRYDEPQKASINQWIAAYATAPDKEAFLQTDAPFEIDDQLRAMPPEQREVMARVFAAQSMPEDMFNATFGAAPDPMTAYQKEMININRGNQEINRLKLGIKREENKLKRETDTLKRQGLEDKINASKQKVAQAQKVTLEKAEDDITKIEQTTDTIDRLIEHPGLAKATGWQANFPTLSGSAASGFEAMLETLQSQAFLSQIAQMKGMGALSENEGKKLAQAIGSLSIDMGDEALTGELGRIKETLEIAKIKARNRMPKAQVETETVETDTGYEEGTVIRNAAGETLILRGGEWVPNA